MLRYALAAALGLAVVLSAGNSIDAQDKAKDKAKATTVEGKLVCTKCTLNETDKCAHAVKVKAGEKTLTYYIDSKEFHGAVCPAGNELAVKVTGTAGKDGDKLTITKAKVEKAK
ncbi:hypothetical protein [Urbifossiella limnaea]|uniref:Uncharacterized protein n=1 Tax=Urbifossiella limnaea TaxID=2528023 RepID=A0A517XVG1_9BACT|nr:hypothetical protein [Urbifossiella limnaea]QDU21501.1 hypothetical protein ETAA1_34680 [Urbifossiella limnaea]